MYDNDFNMEGFGAMPASPYGVHGMDRSDTNSPTAFRGGVTVADPYPTQITADIAQGRGSPTSNYGDAVVFVDASDPRQTRYSYDTKTGYITLPSGGKLRPGSGPAYDALYAQYVRGKTAQGYTSAVQTALSNIAQGITAIPGAYAASQTFDAEAARLAQQQAALTAGGAPATTGAGAGTGTGTQAPAAGMPTWLWLVILGGGAFVVWSVVKGKE